MTTIVKIREYPFHGGSPPYRGYHFDQESSISISSSATVRDLLDQVKLLLDRGDERDLEFEIQRPRSIFGSFKEPLQDSIMTVEVSKVFKGKVKLVAYIPFKRGQVDIGYFGGLVDSAGAKYLTMEEGERQHCPQVELEEIISSLKGHSDATFFTFPPVLDLEQCRKIIHFVDLAYENAGINKKQDFKLKIELHELSRFLDQEQIKTLHSLIQGWDEITIRRTIANGNFINFHLDHALRTLNIPLNGAEEFDGGKLIYVTGQGMISPDRSQPGSGTIHENNIVHGVTKLSKGIRYVLVFQAHQEFKDSLFREDPGISLAVIR